MRPMRRAMIDADTGRYDSDARRAEQIAREGLHERRAASGAAPARSGGREGGGTCITERHAAGVTAAVLLGFFF